MGVQKKSYSPQVSENVYCVLELDPWGYHPLMYIVVGDEKGFEFLLSIVSK